MSSSLKPLICLAVVALAVLGLARAARFKFQEKQDALRAASRAQLQKLGVTRAAAKAKYPTPEIHMVSSGCLLPGSTGEVVVRGKFAPETKFVFENDSIAVVKESLTPTEYRATVQVAAGTGPQSAGVWAMTPVSGIEARQSPGITVGGKYRWEMKGANGWKVVALAPSSKACGGPPNADDQYEVSFYRQAEATPFEKQRASLYHDIYEEGVYRFSISQEDPHSQAAVQDMTTLMQKLSDPKLTDAQRDQLMKQIETAQQQMQADMAKMTDPNYMKQQEAKRQQFGCTRAELKVTGSNFAGTLQCAPAAGARIPVTGTLTFLGK
ncbi:MAG TPA: hypothetical protein VHA11_12200 [Bryobacteraceae bacterium]|nr:hypothetical protein [Bryobacteraceae bacterium]